MYIHIMYFANYFWQRRLAHAHNFRTFVAAVTQLRLHVLATKVLHFDVVIVFHNIIYYDHLNKHINPNHDDESHASELFGTTMYRSALAGYDGVRFKRERDCLFITMYV